MNSYKSKFELAVANEFKKRKLKFGYETKKLPFVQPAKKRSYKPDFELYDSNTIVECKGKLTAGERDKWLWIRETYPDMRFVIIFMRARNKIYKGSPTSYGDWATKNGFEWHDWEEGLPASFGKKKNKKEIN